MLNTETPSRSHPDLDLYAPLDLVRAFTEDQVTAAQVVHAAAPQIARAVEAAAPRIAAGGRLIYVGAGTSGRLGLLDSVELWPTFTWPKDRAIALLAGGRDALFVAVEGAEDNHAQGAADVHAVNPTPNDVVIGLAASGATPYVLGALEAARAAGALTIGQANNPNSAVATAAEIGVTLDTGSELVSGSTRLKAGTSQKIFLNTLSSAIMVRLHKVYGNLMVDVLPTNAKLFRRTIALTVRATGADEATARTALETCNHRVKVAIVMIRRKLDAASAEAKLTAVQGNLRAALGENKS
ncbi:N-acetylmuramic acid 6-phosphate etherase [Oleiharenicola lentus]|uniref:N-acetylmuramic acid 6-phosphate etherase n=1 Tax=Oleiharenicola lentus TaxID=2508720 RepID=UPI003F67ECF7